MKSSRELFGEFVAPFVEAHGVMNFFKVAPNIGFIEGRVRSKGLNMLNFPPFGEPEQLWVIYEVVKQLVKACLFGILKTVYGFGKEI